MADADNLHNQLEVILSAIKAYAATRQYYTTAEVAGKVEKNTFLQVEHHGVTGLDCSVFGLNRFAVVRAVRAICI